jgi:glycosyltransferase involved in cell wall biosynthesis
MRTYWTAQGLAERGHEVHVVTNAREAAAPFRMLMTAADWQRCEGRRGRGSVRVHWTDPVDRSQTYLPMASPFVSKLSAIATRLYAERSFDVIYSHYLEPYGVAGHLASKMTGVPHVTRMAGSDAGRLWHHPQLEPLYDHVLQSAAVLIAAGTVAERAIVHGVDAKRIAFAGDYRLPQEIFTPFGPTLAFATLPSEIERDGGLGDTLWGTLAADRPFLGVYGKLGPTKGSFALLAALHELKRTGRQVGLVALAHGRPEIECEFRQRARELGLERDILQIPFIPHWRVPEFLRGCLAVCCLEQNFPIDIHTPIVAREVLLCGRCLVASTELINKLPDHYRLPHRYGCVAVKDVNNVDELSGRLAEIIDDPEPAEAVGHRGREFACGIEDEADFPQRLERILAAAAERRVLRANAPVRPAPDLTPDPFALTRLCADALGRCPEQNGNNLSKRSRRHDRTVSTSRRRRKSGGINLATARTLLSSIKKAVAKGEKTLLRLVPPIELEIALAVADRADSTSGAAPAFDRVEIRRWAIGANDFAKLRPVRAPQLAVIAFNFAVAAYVAAKTAADFPKVPKPGSSFIAVFSGTKDRQRSVRLIDQGTAQILLLSRGRLTSAQIAAQLVQQGLSSGDAVCLNWMESLFREGFIALRDESGYELRPKRGRDHHRGLQ